MSTTPSYDRIVDPAGREVRVGSHVHLVGFDGDAWPDEVYGVVTQVREHDGRPPGLIVVYSDGNIGLEVACDDQRRGPGDDDLPWLAGDFEVVDFDAYVRAVAPGAFLPERAGTAMGVVAAVALVVVGILFVAAGAFVALRAIL